MNERVSPLEHKEFALRQRIRQLENELFEERRKFDALNRDTSITIKNLIAAGKMLGQELNSMRMYALGLVIVLIIAMWV